MFEKAKNCGGLVLEGCIKVLVITRAPPSDIRQVHLFCTGFVLFHSLFNINIRVAHSNLYYVKAYKKYVSVT